ncbi:MAG: hypothetical protein JWM40_724 [Frankiales bacterium]|nr:hypothetical protein [Frankiales bacterium]
MRRAPRTAAAVLGAACVGALLAVPSAAQAAPVVTLPSGLLTVTIPVAAALSTGPTTISGSLGTTTVIDGRLAAAGYTVTVSTSGFDLLGPAVSSSPVTHIPASASSVQVTGATGVTPGTLLPVSLAAPTPIAFTYSSPVLGLNLLSTYTLGLSIALPSTAGQGAYTGTVTQTVI